MAPQKIPPAERIRELSAINSDVASVLESAGQAINALTNRPLTPTDEDTQMTEGESNTVEAHKQAFSQHTDAYYTGVQAIIARLRRQVYALEEAGIVVPEPATGGTASQAQAPLPSGFQQNRAVPAATTAPKLEDQKIKNGGLGNFDVGWLNSRGNKVGEDKEAELVQQAKDLLENVLINGGDGG